MHVPQTFVSFAAWSVPQRSNAFRIGSILLLLLPIVFTAIRPLGATAMAEPANAIGPHVTVNGSMSMSTDGELNLVAVADTTVDSSAPVDNFGADELLQVGWSGHDSGMQRRTLLTFPVPDLPQEILLVQAQLVLERRSGGMATAARITENWTESSTTWESQPGYGQPTSEQIGPGEVTWDVTALVGGWLSGLYPNHGIALLETIGVTETAHYASRESADPPRLVIFYEEIPANTDPSPPEGLGEPSFIVDPELVPFQEELVPYHIDGEEIQQPLAVLLPEQDTAFTFVADQVIFTPDSGADLEDFMETYDGLILRLPGLPEPPQELADRMRTIPPEESYLVRINPGRVDLESLAEDALALDMSGHMRVSSEEGLRTLALVLREHRAGRELSLNPAGRLTQAPPQFPPLVLREAPTKTGFENPIGQWTLYPELSDVTTQMTGVNRAWQYIAFAQRASPIIIALIDDGFCLAPNGKRCTDAAGAAHLDLPPTFYQYDFHDDDYNASGGITSDWHGAHTTGIATAAQNNQYGIAGVGSPVAEPMMFKVEVQASEVARAIRTATAWGADIVNMSLGIDCNSWCFLFSGISGYGSIKKALIEAEANDLFTVAAAGNDSLDLHDNASIPCVLKWTSLCVGALEASSRKRASYSNYSTDHYSLDLWAPGTAIRVAPNQTYTTNHTVKGTSYSTPFVSGAAALALSVNPNLTRNQLRSLFVTTAHPWPADEKVAKSVNVLKLVRSAGQPLADAYATSSADITITDSGLTDLTVMSGETDTFAYTADQYIQSMEISTTYVSQLGKLLAAVLSPSTSTSDSLLLSAQAESYIVDTQADLCVGDSLRFSVRGVNAAVGNAYKLGIQPTPANSLGLDVYEPNNTEATAVSIPITRATFADFYNPMKIDCKNGLTLHKVPDVDYYTFTVKASDFDKEYTEVRVEVHADFPLTAKLYRNGQSAADGSGKSVALAVSNSQAGTYLLEIYGTTLNAYTVLPRIHFAGGWIRAHHLEAWLKDVTQVLPDQFLPPSGSFPPFPDWLVDYPWDGATEFSLLANQVTPVDGDLGGLILNLEGSPRVIALGTKSGGLLRLEIIPRGGQISAASTERQGVYALLAEADGDELWRVENQQEAAEKVVDAEDGSTYLLLVNGPPGLETEILADLPDAALFLPQIQR